MEIKDILKQHADAVEQRVSALDADVKKALEGAGISRARLDELEQKLARRGSSDSGIPSTTSWGQQFIESEDVQLALKGMTAGHRIGVEVKAIITSATADALGSAGGLVVPARDATYVGPQRRMTVRDLLPQIQVSSGSVEHARRKAFVNASATVAEAASKPQSDLQYELVTEPIRTIAHWVLASRQILDDAPQLKGLIDTDLLYGLQYAEELQLLHGDNTGTNLNGIFTQATAFAAGSTVIADANKIDVIGVAMTQNALAEEPVTGIVVHPSDWSEMRLLKNAEGEYVMGPPGADVEPRLFGAPAVITQAMVAGSFLVGNFEKATLYDRMAARVEVSTEDSDNFRKNLVTVLAEERIGLAVKAPTAFTKGVYATAITDLAS
jgi:HK97 family phage major capsid protein